MKTLEQLIQEESNKNNIKPPSLEDRAKINTIKKDEEIERKINESRGAGWWDGIHRYQYVNRNVVSQCQRDCLFEFTQAVCKHLGIGLGVGGNMITGVVNINIDPGCEPDVLVKDHILPYKDNEAGYVISSHTLEHIPLPKEAIREWIRVIKPGGMIACTLPDKRYFEHENRPGTKQCDMAVAEMNPEELYNILKEFLDKVDILLFDTNKNNFDINFLLRKKG